MKVFNRLFLKDGTPPNLDLPLMVCTPLYVKDRYAPGVFIPLIREAAVAGNYCYIPHEGLSWTFDWRDPTRVGWMRERYESILRKIHEESPEARIGIYSGIPSQWYGLESSYEYNIRLELDEYLYEFASSQLDYISVPAYPYRPDFKTWRERVEPMILRAKMYYRPVFLWLTPRYPYTSKGGIGGKLIDPDFIKQQIATAKRLADGLVLWGKWGESPEKESKWWAKVKEGF